MTSTPPSTAGSPKNPWILTSAVMTLLLAVQTLFLSSCRIEFLFVEENRSADEFVAVREHLELTKEPTPQPTQPPSHQPTRQPVIAKKRIDPNIIWPKVIWLMSFPNR